MLFTHHSIPTDTSHNYSLIHVTFTIIHPHSYWHPSHIHLTQLTHTWHTLNTRLIHSSIHSYPQTPTNQNHSHHLLTSIQYHFDIDPISISISIAYQHNHYTHSSPIHSHNTHTLFTTSHISSYLINDQLIEIIIVYILNHNSYLSYLLKATSITSSDQSATRSAKPDLKSTHFR